MRYRFGDLELDDERVRLSRQGRIVEVEPKPLALLVELLRRHPQVVPTEDLLARVWPDAVVTRASVARAVRALRRALGEEAGSDSVIRSVRGRGYGIAVEVARDRPTAFEPLLQAAEAVSPLVGRDAALALLGRSLRAAASGRGQLATIVGEPGIGKSTLAEALREPAEAAGFAVGFGRATDETGAPSLRPFFEILEALHREVGAERFDEAAQADAAVLSRIAPRLFGAAGHDLSVDAVVEERGGRRVVDAIDAFLQRLSEQKPLLVVVDDLQWADATSCRLFGQLARAVGSQSLLLLGCHRSTEPEGSAPGSPFDALLEQLGGLRDVQAPIELVGLDAAAIGAIAESESDVALDAEAREALRERTGGNPFFAIELARAGAIGSGEAVGGMSERVPARIRTVVRSRVEGLSERARAVLRAAALLGEAFELSFLARLLDCPERSLLGVIDELEQAALVRESPEQPGTFSFVHSLVAEAIVETLSRSERVTLHGDIAATLERIFADRPRAPATAIAYHYARAVAGGDSVDKAVDWACRAGDEAMAQLLFDEAAEHYRRAVDWRRAGSLDTGTEVGRLLIAAGRAELGRGEPSRAEACFFEACEIAERAGEASLLAAGVWPLAASQYRGERADRLQSMLRAAIERSDADGSEPESSVRARLHAALARSQSYTADFETVDASSRRAVALAREAEDLDCELKALSTRDLVLAAEPQFAERAELSRDRIGLAIEVGHVGEEFMARVYRIIRLVQEAAAEEIDRELDRCEALAEHTPAPARARAYLLDARVLRCCWRGEVADADALMPRLREAWESVDPLYSMMSLGAKTVLLDRLAGRHAPVGDEELRSALGGSRFALPRPYVCSIAVGLWEEGRQDEARQVFEYLSRRHYADVQRDVTYLVTIVQLAELAHRFGDTERAALLAEALDPFAGRYAAGHTAAVRGAVDRYRGLLAWTRGDLDGADALLEAAVAVEVRMDAAPWEALVRADRARLALDRGGAGRRQLAEHELERAQAALDRRAVPGMQEFVDAERARL